MTTQLRTVFPGRRTLFLPNAAAVEHSGQVTGRARGGESPFHRHILHRVLKTHRHAESLIFRVSPDPGHGLGCTPTAQPWLPWRRQYCAACAQRGQRRAGSDLCDVLDPDSPGLGWAGLRFYVILARLAVILAYRRSDSSA